MQILLSDNPNINKKLPTALVYPYSGSPISRGQRINICYCRSVSCMIKNINTAYFLNYSFTEEDKHYIEFLYFNVIHPNVFDHLNSLLEENIFLKNYIQNYRNR